MTQPAVEIALNLTLPTAGLALGAQRIARTLASTRAVPFRLAGYETDSTHTHLTFALALGTPEEIAANAPRARAAADLVCEIILTFPAFEPAFVPVPDLGTSAAQAAETQVDLANSIHTAATVTRAELAQAAANRAAARAQQARLAADAATAHAAAVIATPVRVTAVNATTVDDAENTAEKAAARAAAAVEQANHAADVANRARRAADAATAAAALVMAT